MPQTVDLGPKLQVFRCPQCNEVINLSAERCRFCNTSIDPLKAQAAAELHHQVNQAIDSASYLRILAGTMVVFYIGGFLPIVGTPAGIGFFFLMLTVPIQIIRFWRKHLGIHTSDPGMKEAQRNMVMAMVIRVVMMVVFVIVRVFFAAAMTIMRA